MRHRYVLVCALVAAVALPACGNSASRAELAPAAAQQQVASALAADLQPLHAEAVELADLVLAAGPDTATADAVRRVRQVQSDLLARVDSTLRSTGATPGENAALAAQELDAVRVAAAEQAVVLGLDGLFRNHLAALARAKQEVAEASAGPSRELADLVLAEQGPMLQELTALPRP